MTDPVAEAMAILAAESRKSPKNSRRLYAVGIIRKKRLTFQIQENGSITCPNRGRQAEEMIDPDGYRPNVAIVLMNNDRRVFWAQRSNNDGWQFPQGGMHTDETPLEAMYRELREETGLTPRRYRRHYSKPLCIGQKQVWFLLRFLGSESSFSLDSCDEPEFCTYKWVDFWYPVENVVMFKRSVYQKALSLLEPMANSHNSTS
jgi:putative (di)nucleoside polyphosphate hydrolase